MESLLDRLKREMAQKTFDSTSKQAYKWLRGRVNQLPKTTNLKDSIIKDKVAKKQFLSKDPGPINIGSMICYAYDPKHKKTLPYYDMFPVGFIVGINSKTGNWQMLNLHYLPPQYRALLFDQLMTITNNKKFDASTKLKLSYDILSRASKFALFRPCFKEYIPGQVRSKIIKIPPDEWSTVMFLPLAQFKKASASQIWSDSMRK